MARRDEDTTPAVERRAFLGLAMGGAASVVASCGDDIPDAGLDSGSFGDGAGGPTTTAATEADVASSTAGASLDGTGDDTGGDGSSGSSGGPPLECDETNAFEETWDPEAVPQDDVLFPLAIMAGEMLTNSAMFTAYIEDAQPKVLRVWRPGEREGTPIVVAEVEVEPSADGYAKALVDGLCPGIWYAYAWFVGAPGSFTARSALGNVRTALADGVLEPVTIAMTACNGDSFDWPALAVTADEPYDMFLHLGDMAYNDGASTLTQYRNSWKQYLAVDDMRRAYARSGLYATWDDHEVDDNSNLDRETMDPAQLEKRQNAMDAYFELMPIDAEGPNYRLWRSFKWGATVEIFVLDCRFERRPSMGLYMSQAQMDWLKEGLAASPCHFKLIMNSVPITNMPGVWDVAAEDRWEGYPNSRDELLAHIAGEQIDNVWFISGDFHVCFVSTLELDADEAPGGLREIAVTGGNVNPLGDFLAEPQYAYGTSDPRGCLLTLDPEGNFVNVRFIDPETGTDEYNADLSYDE